MSLTLLAWLLLFVLLAGLSFARPAWGVALYMLTVFLCPPFWWWGDMLRNYRWNFVGGLILLIAVICSRERSQFTELSSKISRVWQLAALVVLNATFVHFLLADNLEISLKSYTFLLKYSLLFALITLAIRTPNDFRIVTLAILLGATYIGYEVTINERGSFDGNRLEGVGLPNASSANGLASLLITVLPLTGAYFIAGRKWERLLMIIVAPFIVNVVLLCNSRGAFLAAIASGIIFILMTPRRCRKKALKIVACGCVAVWMLLGDATIIERFMTTFAKPEERDQSAASRLELAQAGLAMVKDYPLGAGGEGFKRAHGAKYIKTATDGYLADQDVEKKAVHNGFINTACEWGLQGFGLRIVFLFTTMAIVWTSTRRCATSGDDFAALIGAAILAGASAFLISCLFGDYLDDEWGYWMAALAVAHGRVFSTVQTPGDNLLS